MRKKEGRQSGISFLETITTKFHFKYITFTQKKYNRLATKLYQRILYLEKEH